MRLPSSLYSLRFFNVSDFSSGAGNAAAALASYTQLHAACLGHVAEGSFYLAASCSSHVDMPRFEGTLREGAQRAGVILQVLERSHAPADHPRLAAFPEGDYLKVVLTRVVGRATVRTSERR